MTNLGLNSTSSIIGSTKSAIFLIKSRDVSSEVVYQKSTFTILSVGGSRRNSAVSAIDLYSSSAYSSNLSIFLYLSKIYFLIFSPYLLLISIAGILIPMPAPSSDRITSDTSSSELEMIIARAPPALSMFLTCCTNEH